MAETLFKRYGEDYGFDWLLLASFAFQESGFDQKARSNAGAVGVMQLLPSTAADPSVGIPDIQSLENNIHAGTKVRQRLDDGLVRVGLHGVAQRHVHTVKRLAQHLIVPSERRGGIAVERRFKIKRQVRQRNIFRVQDAITVGKVVHELKIRN